LDLRGRKCWESGERLHNEELHNFYASSNIIRVIKSRMMRWAGHVAHMAKMRNTILWAECLKERDHSKDLGEDGRIILKDIRKVGGVD